MTATARDNVIEIDPYRLAIDELKRTEEHANQRVSILLNANQPGPAADMAAVARSCRAAIHKLRGI